MENKNKKKTVAEIDFKRSRGRQYLYIKVIPEIEELFKHERTTTSDSYRMENGEGAIFYNMSDNISRIEDTLQNRGENLVISRYGYNITRRETPNYSVLRTVGIKDGVTVSLDATLTSDVEFKQWVEGLGKFIKILYLEVLGSRSIKMKVVIE